MVLSDSHCHLEHYQGQAMGQLLKQAQDKGVDMLVTMGMTVESSAETISRAQSYPPRVLAAVGIHPWNAISPSNEVRQKLDELARRKEAVAMGEIGLDYVRNPGTEEVQKELLRYELSLARKVGLPVSLHCREAHQDMMDIVRPESKLGLKGSVHGFTGDRKMLQDWLQIGFYISIGVRGFVTDEIPALVAAVRDIPLDHLLTETDSAGRDQPDGQVGALLAVVQKLAALKSTTPEQIADTATANLKHLLRL